MCMFDLRACNKTCFWPCISTTERIRQLPGCHLPRLNVPNDARREGYVRKLDQQGVRYTTGFAQKPSSIHTLLFMTLTSMAR